jgi:hypothetical protein
VDVDEGRTTKDESESPSSFLRRLRTLRLTSVIKYLIPLLLALLVLWAGYSSATHKRYEALNGLPGQLLAGGSIGQTFVAEWDGLSGIDVRLGTYGRQVDPHRATLVMYLRESPSSRIDITTASLPPSAVLDENGWYHFSFPAVDGSKGKNYYAEIESPDGTVANGMGLYWFKPLPLGDPYPQGTAYLNGKPVKADLTFGLGYSATPVEVWQGMLQSAAANSSSLAIGALLVLAVAGIVWALVWLPGIFRDPERRSRWLVRWSLLFVLGVALVTGLLFMLLVPPWQGPDEYSHFAYAVLLDKHNLDSKQVDALNLYGKDQDKALIEAINASADSHDFTRLFLGSAAPGAPTDVTGNVFQQTRQPALYYWLCAVALRLARALGVPANPYTNPETALMVMRSVSLLLGLVVVALAWLAGMLLSGRPTTDDGQKEPRPSSSQREWLRLLLPLTVALLPMHVFIATVANNDILAEVAVTALFVSLVALLRWPGGLRGLGLAALAVVLALASVGTKSTATAAALPLLVGGLVVWGAILIANYLSRKPLRITHYALRIRSRLLAVAAAIVLVTLVLVGAVLLAYKRDEQSATGWFIVSYDPIVRAARVKSDTAHQGSYVIEVNTGESNRAIQNLVPPISHPALDVTFSGWARLAPGQSLGPNTPSARISIMEGDREAGFGEAQLAPGNAQTGPEWTHLTATGKISASAWGVDLRLEGLGKQAKVQFDDLSLHWSPVGGTWNDPIYKPALLNPSGEEPPTILNDAVKRILPGEVRAMADVLANPQEIDRWALWRDYATLQYQTFWGSFGWLTINLPGVFYVLLGVLLLVAVAGLVVGVARGGGLSRWAGLGLAVLFALAVAILTGFAKQESLLTYAGRPAYPQGRYLFVLAVPLVWLVLVGLSEVLWAVGSGRWAVGSDDRREFASSSTDDGPPLRITHWGIWLWVVALGFFAAYCLFALITPFYYS